ncbi:MAG: hypothetical protein U9O18_06285 [Chloroflexota bacterium]|nr:hypothetical protein [Chloroflexota bacterium]
MLRLEAEVLFGERIDVRLEGGDPVGSDQPMSVTPPAEGWLLQ